MADRCRIDALCLGGQSNNSTQADFSRFWHGGKRNESKSRVNRFLFDVEKSCRQIAAVVRPGGRVVFVVARRTVARYRVYLDLFLKEVMIERGFLLDEFYTRSIEQKNTPWVVSRSGRKSRAKSSKNRVTTMRTEYVLVFSRSQSRKS